MHDAKDETEGGNIITVYYCHTNQELVYDLKALANQSYLKPVDAQLLIEAAQRLRKEP